jgi:hypothetical protein
MCGVPREIKYSEKIEKFLNYTNRVIEHKIPDKRAYNRRYHQRKNEDNAQDPGKCVIDAGQQHCYAKP